MNFAVQLKFTLLLFTFSGRRKSRLADQLVWRRPFAGLLYRFLHVVSEPPSSQTRKQIIAKKRRPLQQQHQQLLPHREELPLFPRPRSLSIRPRVKRGRLKETSDSRRWLPIKKKIKVKVRKVQFLIIIFLKIV